MSISRQHLCSICSKDQGHEQSLIAGWFDGSLSPSQGQELARLLHSSKEFQNRFRSYAQEQAALMMVAQRNAVWLESSEPLPFSDSVTSDQDIEQSQTGSIDAPWTWQILPVSAAAAAALLALWVGIPLATNAANANGASSVEGRTAQAAPQELRLRLEKGSERDVQVLHDITQQRRVMVQVSPSSDRR